MASSGGAMLVMSSCCCHIAIGSCAIIGSCAAPAHLQRTHHLFSASCPRGPMVSRRLPAIHYSQAASTRPLDPGGFLSRSFGWSRWAVRSVVGGPFLSCFSGRGGSSGDPDAQRALATYTYTYIYINIYIYIYTHTHIHTYISYINTHLNII